MSEIPSIEAATPAEYAKRYEQWRAFYQANRMTWPTPLPMWCGQICFRLGQLEQPNHPNRAVHFAELAREHGKFMEAWAEKMG